MISPIDGNHYLCSRDYLNSRRDSSIDQEGRYHSYHPPSDPFNDGLIYNHKIAELEVTLKTVNQKLEEYANEICRAKMNTESMDWMNSTRSCGVSTNISEEFTKRGRLRPGDYKSTVQQQDEILRCLCMARMQNEDVLIHLGNNSISEHDWVVGIDNNGYMHGSIPTSRKILQIPSEEPLISQAEIIVFHFIQAQYCTQCKTLVEAKRIDEHLQHPECLIKRDEIQATGQGLKKIKFHDGLIARLAGVSNMTVATNYDIYVEPWVEKAIETYRKVASGNDGPYAGLTLQEYLTKIKPNQLDTL